MTTDACGTPVAFSPAIATTDPSAFTSVSACNNASIVGSSASATVDDKPTPVRNTYQEFISQYKQNNGFARGGMVQNYAAGGAAANNPYGMPANFCINTNTPAPIQHGGGACSLTCIKQPGVGLQVAEAIPYVGSFITGLEGQTEFSLGGAKTHPGPLGVFCGHTICYINGTAGYGGVKQYSNNPYFSTQPGVWLQQNPGYTCVLNGCCGFIHVPTPTCGMTPFYKCGNGYSPNAVAGECPTYFNVICQTSCAWKYTCPNTGQPNSCVNIMYPEFNNYYCVIGLNQNASGQWTPPWEGGNSFCPWKVNGGTGYTGGTTNNYPQIGALGTMPVLSPTTDPNGAGSPSSGGGPVLSPPTDPNGAGTPASTAGCPYATAGVPGATPGANTTALQTQTQNATNPVLPPGTQYNPALIHDSACQSLNSNGYTVGTGQVNPVLGGCAQTVGSVNPITASTYAAAQTCPAFSIKPAQGAVDPCAIVSNQLQKLTCFKNGTPEWAQPAINAANSAMAARGLGSSTIMGGAFINAIESAALPVAQSNAQYFANLDLANLTNQQQATITGAQLTAQALLSNTAAQNAASQFNATSENQTEQFMSNLNSQIQLTNAAQINAMKQFNSGQANAVGEFNANMANNVAQFNAQNRLAIDQSNVTWRRNINTLNTAAQNAALQVNAQNLFNLSATAQNDLWQQLQDQASWANTDAQNNLTRAQNMAIASLGAQTAFNLQNQSSQAALMQYLGQFGLNLVGSAVGSLFSPPSPTNSSNPAQEAQACITSNQTDIQNVLNGGTAGSSCCPF